EDRGPHQRTGRIARTVAALPHEGSCLCCNGPKSSGRLQGLPDRRLYRDTFYEVRRAFQVERGPRGLRRCSTRASTPPNRVSERVLPFYEALGIKRSLYNQIQGILVRGHRQRPGEIRPATPLHHGWAVRNHPERQILSYQDLNLASPSRNTSDL